MVILPTVLYPGAMLPPVGTSGLPKSLEIVTPPELRFWETNGEEARKRHRELVSSGFFRLEDLKIVDGEVRKTVTFLYEPDWDLPEDESISKSAPFHIEMPIAKAVEEKRYFLAVVLEPLTPDNPDLQKEFYTEESIQKAMFRFMDYVCKGIAGSRDYGLGVMHRRDDADNAIADNSRLLLKENYQTPVEFSLVNPFGETKVVKKGTWLQGWQVPDQEIWDGIKSRKYRGLSIDGKSKKRRYRKVS